MDQNEAKNRLDALGDLPDLDVMERTADSLEQTLRTDDPEGYPRFVIELCDRLNSYDHGDWQRQDRLVRKYGELALQHARTLPLGVELHLLEHIIPTRPQRAADPAVWPTLRRESARRWLSALGRLDRELDDGFDPTDVPALNLAVPGDGLPAGAAAEHVQDPALRQQYAEDVARNQAHATRYARQMELRRLAERYRSVAQRYLAASYAQPPDNLDELRRLLAEHVSDPSWRAEILSAVEQGPSRGAG